MKKSAVEFMVKEISEILGPLKTEGMTDLLLLDAYNQAKAMEKKQEERAYKRGQKHKKPLKDSNPINKYLKSE